MNSEVEVIEGSVKINSILTRNNNSNIQLIQVLFDTRFVEVIAGVNNQVFLNNTSCICRDVTATVIKFDPSWKVMFTKINGYTLDLVLVNKDEYLKMFEDDNHLVLLWGRKKVCQGAADKASEARLETMVDNQMSKM